MRGRVRQLLLHFSAGQALDWAVRFCAVAQIIGLLELAIVRHELAPGGFLDWTFLGSLNPRTRTKAGSHVRRLFCLISPRLFVCLLFADAAFSIILLARPRVALFIAVVLLLHLAIMKRHHLTFDGSDHMLLVVLLACLLGRVTADPLAARAAVTFLAAEVTLAYLVAGLYKATSPYWQSGNAIAMVVQTRMLGQATAARLIRRFPAIGHAATYVVFSWETLFCCFTFAPPAIIMIMLAIGIGFHLGCSIIMGLNRFLFAFVASYPAVLWVNTVVRSAIGASVSNFITAGMVALGGIGLGTAFFRYRFARLTPVSTFRPELRLAGPAQSPGRVKQQ